MVVGGGRRGQEWGEGAGRGERGQNGGEERKVSSRETPGSN